MRSLASVKGLLLDLDGVCYVDGVALPGAAQALSRIAAAGLPCRFLTNTTTRSRMGLASRLRTMGLSIAEETVFNAPRAAARYLLEQGLSARLVVADEVRVDFDGCRQDDAAPDAVVIGDIGSGWSYALLNGIFRQLLAGARLVALHKGRYWQTSEGLSLDIGAFVAGLEYASNSEALVVGKPSPAFFLQAIADIALPVEALAIVGDDIETDIGGGQACGLTGILVQTGKWRSELAARSSVQPHHEIESIADLPQILGIP